MVTHLRTLVDLNSIPGRNPLAAQRRAAFDAVEASGDGFYLEGLRGEYYLCSDYAEAVRCVVTVTRVEE